MKSSNRSKILLGSILFITLYSGALFTFAIYQPSDQMLDPTCLPTDLGCYVSGGTPSSPLNSIQYNNAGSFYGDSLFTRDATTNLTQIGRTHASYNIPDPTFLGTGLDDLLNGTMGGYTGSLPNTYTITIDSTGIFGDTFSWSDSYGNSGSGISISGGGTNAFI